MCANQSTDQKEGMEMRCLNVHAEYEPEYCPLTVGCNKLETGTINPKPNTKMTK